MMEQDMLEQVADLQCFDQSYRREAIEQVTQAKEKFNEVKAALNK